MFKLDIIGQSLLSKLPMSKLQTFTVKIIIVIVYNNNYYYSQLFILMTALQNTIGAMLRVVAQSGIVYTKKGYPSGERVVYKFYFFNTNSILLVHEVG